MVMFKNCISLIIVVSFMTGCFAGRKGSTENVVSPESKEAGSRRESEKAFDWDSYFDLENADFKITSLTAKVQKSDTSYEKGTGLLSSIEYSFTMKVASMRNNRQLMGQKFLIQGFHGESSHTDEASRTGEITWSETIQFDELRPQQDPILISKKVIGLGAAKGMTHAVYEINPWAETERGISVNFQNLTYKKNLLKKRHKFFNPKFNYVTHMASPSIQKKDPSVIIKRAAFYIKRETPINSTISKEFEGSYVPELRMNTAPYSGKNSRLSLSEHYRGNYHNADAPNYVEKKPLKSDMSTAPVGLKLNLEANLQLGRKYWIGDKVNFKDVDQGAFKVYVALLGSNQGLQGESNQEPVLLAVSSVPKISTIIDNKLTVSFDLIAPYMVNRGDIELLIKVVPLKKLAQKGLKPFGTIYKVGRYNKLSGFSRDFRVSDAAKEDFNYDSYLKGIKDFRKKHEELLLSSGYLTDIPGIVFSAMQIKFRTVKAGETATQRTVIFSVTTCPYDGLTGARFDKGRKFNIYVSGLDPLTGEQFSKVPLQEIRKNSKDGTISVNSERCLSWTDEIAHKYYQREKLIDRKYYLESDGESYSLSGYFNPWDEKYGTLGVDSRTLSEEFIQEIKNREKLPSRFFTGDFSYMTLRFRYSVDEDMHLTVKKTVLMSLYPFIKRYSNIINGINGNFPIRDGIYLLKLAYQKDYIDPGAKGVRLKRKSGDSSSLKAFIEDPATLSSTKIDVTTNANNDSARKKAPFFDDDLRRRAMIYVTKKLIRVEKNRVVTPIEFKIEDLRTLRIRSNLMVQLEPVNQYKLQIVNLFEKHIAKELTLKVGNLNKVQCLDPGTRDLLLNLFQQVIDGVALAIPDDINYNSLESFNNVINSTAVRKALEPLTKSGLLGGLSNAFKLDFSKKQLAESFKLLSAEELSEISGIEELDSFFDQKASEDQKTSLKEVAAENRVLSILKSLADNAAGNESLAPMGDEKGGSSEANALGTDEQLLHESVQRLKGTRAASYDKETEGFLEKLSGKKSLQTLLNNDFTIDPAVTRVSDLDYLIDRKAGIKRRTFIGPLTLIALDNKNTMNATDALDYNYCSNDDCSDQNVKDSFNDDENYSYARSPYFGYQGQFKNCHVDDFIIKKSEEELLYRAWNECVSGLQKKSNGEISIGKDFSCDYSSTKAYAENPMAFKRFLRTKEEKTLENNGACLYRDKWLKKHFAQKKTDEMRRQFSNFLAHPTVTAKLVVPPEGSSIEKIKVGHVSEECSEKGYIKKDCILSTDKFNLTSEDLAKEFLRKSYLSATKFQGGFSLSNIKGGLTLDEKGFYKKSLIEFYTNNKAAFSGEGAGYKTLGKNIYKTLVDIAAPKQNLLITYEGRLDQAAPADFGMDVQKFMCNILLPQARKLYIDLRGEVKPFSMDNFDVFSNAQGTSKEKIAFAQLRKDCFSYAETNNVEIPLPFHIERKFKVLKTGRYFFRGGKSININTGQSVGIGHNIGWSDKVSLDPYGALKDLASGALNDSSKKSKMGKLGSTFLGSFSLPDFGKSESNSYSDGMSLATGAHLSMQSAQLDLELLRYRRCMLVRWNPKYLEHIYSGEFEEFEAFKSKKSYFKDKLPSVSNIFVCGEAETKPIAIKEDYYYLTQHFTEGDMLDSGSLLNNPWLLRIRGYRDMVAFITSLYPKSNFDPSLKALMEDGANKVLSKRKIFTPSQVKPEGTRMTYETELMAWQSMAETYKSIAPTFPGIFTQLNDRERSLPDWPWDQEVQIDTPQGLKCK